MNYSQYQYGHPGYSYPQSYSDPYAQAQQYQAPPTQYSNPYVQPPATGVNRPAFPGTNPNYDPEYEAAIAQWQSAYAPAEDQEKNKKGNKSEKGVNSNPVPSTSRSQSVSQPAGGDGNAKTDDDKRKTVIRKGGGQTWEDPSLLEWDPTQFRIMVGNLAGEVTDESLAKAFAQYGVSKARVIRDKRTTKSKGYGFVSFTDGEQGFKAAREMVGKYIGSHPVTIQRSKTDIKPVIQKHDKYKGKNNKNRDKRGKQEDPLRAHTGAQIEKKPVRNLAGMKMLG
ncbi:hypothetical protein M433DRAFT_249930 [Acidomyces richmondensis BFW]|nr:MAG: hypothetical protein FE78DRAFT_415871 [Acidomyces sp. 'richmondensis']KYG45531.1 hypothetical protein M433DRAFT_249930 [Acidomyces richmondensis BFW]